MAERAALRDHPCVQVGAVDPARGSDVPVTVAVALRALDRPPGDALSNATTRTRRRPGPEGTPPEWSTLEAGPIQEQCWSILKNAGRLNDDEVNYGQALWRLLHLEGPHHELSTESTARFRIEAVLAFARMLLRRDVNLDEKKG